MITFTSGYHLRIIVKKTIGLKRVISDNRCRKLFEKDPIIKNFEVIAKTEGALIDTINNKNATTKHSRASSLQ